MGRDKGVSLIGRRRRGRIYGGDSEASSCLGVGWRKELDFNFSFIFFFVFVFVFVFVFIFIFILFLFFFFRFLFQSSPHSLIPRRRSPMRFFPLFPFPFLLTRNPFRMHKISRRRRRRAQRPLLKLFFKKFFKRSMRIQRFGFFCCRKRGILRARKGSPLLQHGFGRNNKPKVSPHTT